MGFLLLRRMLLPLRIGLEGRVGEVSHRGPGIVLWRRENRQDTRDGLELR